MYKLKILAVVAASLVISGCVTLSMHPLYFDQDIIYEPALEGVWGNPDKTEVTWTFEKSGDNSYRLVYKEHGITKANNKNEKDKYSIVETENPEKDGVFKVHLMKFGKYYFIDLFPEEPKHINEVYKYIAIPTHLFIKISLEDDVLQLVYLDHNWLKDGLKNNSIQIKHEMQDDTIILTASTKELQEFILKYIDEAFEDIDKADHLRHL